MSVFSETAAHSAFPEQPKNQRRYLDEPRAYGPEFWIVYGGNTAFTIAVALMYRYADFVLYLGGSEWNVGVIVGVGMVGSLVMRLFQGFGLDHFGPRRIWLWSNFGLVFSLIAHTLITDVRGPGIFALRILYATSMAGVYGSSITSVSRRLPLARMAEVVGMLGTSGFIGMAVGPMLGDLFCGHSPITRTDLNTMFLVAAGLGAVSFCCAAVATRRELKPTRHHRKPPMVWLLRRYHPGTVMMLAIVMGIGLVIPTTFLPTFIQHYHIENTGTFFLVYAGTAFLARISTRRFPHLFGVRPMIFIGLGFLAVSLLCYMTVTTQWGLAVPGFFAGIAHAVMFPSVTATGSTSFPSRYRGLGTTVMLSMLDTGMLVGAPLVGQLLVLSKNAGLPPYNTTFVVLSIGVVASGVVYAIFGRR
jgi:MFS family permease